jgi:hypothetical protein
MGTVWRPGWGKNRPKLRKTQKEKAHLKLVINEPAVVMFR